MTCHCGLPISPEQWCPCVSAEELIEHAALRAEMHMAAQLNGFAAAEFQHRCLFANGAPTPLQVLIASAERFMVLGCTCEVDGCECLRITLNESEICRRCESAVSMSCSKERSSMAEEKKFQTLKLNDLEGRSGRTRAYVVRNRTEAMRLVREGKPVTAAGQEGALNVWRDTSRKLHASFSRYRIEKSHARNLTLHALGTWLREWWPSLGRL